MLRVDGALQGKQDGTKSLDYWLLPANTSECYLYTEQMGVKCIIVFMLFSGILFAQDSHTTDGGSTFW